MTNVNRTFSIDTVVSKRIDDISRRSRRNKSQVVEELIRKSMNENSEEISHLIKIESQVNDLKNIIEKIYRI